MSEKVIDEVRIVIREAQETRKGNREAVFIIQNVGISAGGYKVLSPTSDGDYCVGWNDTMVGALGRVQRDAFNEVVQGWIADKNISFEV